MKTLEKMLKGCEHDGSYIPVNEVKRLMQEYAFLAWMAGEENGRSELSSYSELDKEGSKKDFEQWLESKLNKHVVSISLPTDECIEEWWSKENYKNDKFWKDAPYRTNGDVIEDIKMAVKYFITRWQ